MAMHLMRIPVMLVVATVAILSGCASASKTHHLETAVADQRQAEVAYEQGNLTQALAGYEALTRSLPSNADFWFRLGNIHVRMEQPDLAVAAYERTLQLDPENAKAWHNLGIVRMRQAVAAFAQSAHAAGPDDRELGRTSAQLAHSLAELVSPAKQELPAPKAATSDMQGTTPATGEGTP